MCTVPAKGLYIFIICIGISLLPISAASAAPSPQPPEESITYWKPFEISQDDDQKVKEAHQVFNRLLSGWEETRLAPRLYVIHSDAGPWAASLDDGSILLSREAMEVREKNSSKMSFLLRR